jgi:hypothetical protein
MRNRRQFFEVLIRGGILSSLALFTGIMGVRMHENPGCRNDRACGACDLSDECRLPEADKHRLEKAKHPKSYTPDGSAGR